MDEKERSLQVSRTNRGGHFSSYRQQLQDRLRRHGLEKLFQLDEEPDRQDKLTT